MSAAVSSGRSRSTASAADARGRRQILLAPTAADPLRAAPACSSGSAWRASVGASGSLRGRFIPARNPAARRTPAAISSPKLAHLGVLGSLQPADLLFQRADAGHLPDVGGNAPEQQVARHVEGARREVALVGVRLHLLRPRQRLGQAVERARVNLARRPAADSRRPARYAAPRSPSSSGGVTKPDREKS